MVIGRKRPTLEEFPKLPEEEPARWERIPGDAAGRLAKGAFNLAPDVAIETLAADQSLAKLADRCRWYVANGVPLALLVNPEDTAVLEFRPGRELRTLRGRDRIEFGDLIPGIAFSVVSLFKSLEM